MSDKVQPVSRNRRAGFVFATVAAAFLISTGLSIWGAETEVIKVVAGKMLDLAQMLGIIYVSASSVDYTFKPLLSRKFKDFDVDEEERKD